MRSSKVFCVLSIISMGVFSSVYGADSEKDPILGQWKWFTKSVKVFHADGRVTNPEGSIEKGGTWKRLNPGEEPGRYELDWSSGKFVDTFTLEDNGSRISGKNAKEHRVSARRLSREDPDGTAETAAAVAPAAKDALPSKRIEPLLEPSLNAILAPLGENPKMPRIPVETLRASLGGGVVTAKTPAQQQIYQCAMAVCDALTNGMDERAQARAAAIQSGLLPSISTGGGIVKTMPLRGWDAGHAGDAIRKKQKDERAYADKQAKDVSNFADSAAYKAWVAKTTVLRDNAMDLYTKLVQLEAADSVADARAVVTGEVLYALEQSPDASWAGAIARAQEWLLDRQREDGGWSIDITRISRLDRSGPAKAKSFKDATGIYTFWGSAWATIGLLQALPITEP